MRKFMLIAMLALGGRVSAQVENSAVVTERISANSPAHYWYYTAPQVTVAAGSVLASFVYPGPGSARLVDVIVYQLTAGTSGTSWTLNVRNQAGTSLLTTSATITLAAGANVSVDARAELALPGGCTRPVIKTDGTQIVSKGTYVDIFSSESGTYSPHPSGRIVLVFEPLQ